MSDTKVCKDCPDKGTQPIKLFKERTYFREHGKSYTTNDARCDPCRLIWQRVQRTNYIRRTKIKINPHGNLDEATKKFLY